MFAARSSEPFPLLSASVSAWRAALAAMAVGLAAVLTAHATTIDGVISTWQRMDSYQYAWFVLPVLAYLLWHRREQFQELAPKASISGVLATALCALLWVASDILNIAIGRQVALVGGIIFVILAAVGWPAFRRLVPYLAMLLLLLPSGDILVTPLKHITIAMIHGFTAIAGLPFLADGFTVFIGSNRYAVIDACAGLPYFLIGIFLGHFLALQIYRSWWKIAAMAAFGGGLAILANGLRVSGIVLSDYLNGEQMDLTSHSAFEWPALALAFATLFVVFSRLKQEAWTSAKTGDADVEVAYSRFAIGMGLVAAALLASAPVIVRGMQTENSMQRDAKWTELPSSVGGWEQQTAMPEWQPSIRQGTDIAQVSAIFSRASQEVTVFTATAFSLQDKISGGALDLAGDELWMLAAAEQLTVCARERCHQVMYQKQVLRKSNRKRHVYALYLVGPQTISSDLELRMRRGWASLTGSDTRAQLIAIASHAVDDDVPVEPAEIAELLNLLSRQL